MRAQTSGQGRLVALQEFFTPWIESVGREPVLSAYVGGAGSGRERFHYDLDLVLNGLVLLGHGMILPS